ncbi:transcription factor [Punctularia strigosozonata HHB-11173 SS5]|uniref:transcription factor n=1 Tax=Punctularia strigosozonata (strain HHB-11173) TaxID=741275 RepID=UPI00044163A9|nr:transcription factor [Punctularia strigosozonata HHB-11173 SS5]EIN12047.1 transcription factor [Punctularia strigosozonata HHB-11173 SS5]
MDPGSNSTGGRNEEELRYEKRAKLRDLNLSPPEPPKNLDSSLKRHTALMKRIRLSIGTDNRDQVLKDIESLSLEKYVDEIPGAIMEGISRCKTEKDVWSAVEIISAMHRRFPTMFTPSILSALSAALAPPNRATMTSLLPEQREKDDAARISKQRPVLRVCSELALVGIIKSAEWIMKAIKELLSNDPTLSSLPLLTTFLKSYSRPYLGIVPPANVAKQISSASEPGTMSAESSNGDAAGAFPTLFNEERELVSKDVRDRFKRMCEGYFENVSKKLVIEHKRLQEQDRRNHEAYIRSGEIFEDRQQAYEKMTRSYEKLLASCQTLSESLYLPMPELPTASQKADSILIGSNTNSLIGGDGEEVIMPAGAKWEDEEERRFFEDIQDLKDFVPRGVLGIEEDVEVSHTDEEKEKSDKARMEEEARKIDEELEVLGRRENEQNGVPLTSADAEAEPHINGAEEYADDEDASTLVPGTPKTASPPGTPQLAPQGPSQLLTALLARLPDCTNRAMIDQAAIDFAFLNSKAARKRLVRFLSQTPKNRIDLLPHYSRLVATLHKYMPDLGSEVVAVLDEEFRYLQRKKKVVKELAEVRLKNITFISNLTKFRVVPPHVILHMFKVCLDDFSGTNVDNLALLLEGCGRFLLRSDDTRERFAKMLELMRRKQSMQHFDQRQIMMLENAYYQCNPPERAPREMKQRTPMELFIRHLIYDVLAKKTIDKVLKLIRKLDWDDASVARTLHKVFTKPWKIKYSNISLLAMLTYDLQRYHPAFTVAVVDQVLEDIRIGLEHNVYNTNQRRLATMKYLGELYIYRLFGSGIIFDTLWSLVTFGHPENRPLPKQPCALDMPDDFFRIRLVCVLLDTCGMCFDNGSQRKKLDNFLVFFNYYVLCKDPIPMDVEFMLSDSLEAVRPKLVIPKSIEEAANAVDDMLNAALQTAGITAGDDSDDDSGNEQEDGEGRPDVEDDEEADGDGADSPVEDRAPSPDEVVVLTSQSNENLGPSEDDMTEFEREFAKMITDSTESRKVDKKTALALWDATVLPAPKKKRADEDEEDAVEHHGEASRDVMNFTLVTKRGNKQQVRPLAIPAASALAAHTRDAQQRDREEQQHLKQLVLNYEQREEAEELKALETRNRYAAVKVRYVG